MGLLDVKPKPVEVVAPNATPPAAAEEKPKRGRPAGSTTRKRTTSTRKKATAVDHSQVALLLVTVSSIGASREGFEDLALTLDEANQIAQPLANILGKNEGLGNVTAEYADHIALAFAAFTIMLPKIMLFLQKRKAKKEEDQQNANQAGTITTNDQQPDRQNRNTELSQNDATQFAGSINDILAPII